MAKIWIIGGGRFGRQAAQKLLQSRPTMDITVIEQDVTVCKRLLKQPFNSICTDGIGYLSENLQASDDPDWIIPAIPVHVAYEWIRQKLSGRYFFQPLAVPEEVAGILPNMVSGADGECYISNADFICPDDCREPSETCTHTGKPRPRILHSFLKAIRHDNFGSIVITSRQLGPGIGGYAPAALFQALDEVVVSKPRILLSTACRCHGVMHAFNISRY